MPSSGGLLRFLGRHPQFGSDARHECQHLPALRTVTGSGSFGLALVAVSTSPGTVHEPLNPRRSRDIPPLVEMSGVEPLSEAFSNSLLTVRTELQRRSSTVHYQVLSTDPLKGLTSVRGNFRAAANLRGVRFNASTTTSTEDVDS